MAEIQIILFKKVGKFLGLESVPSKSISGNGRKQWQLPCNRVCRNISVLLNNIPFLFYVVHISGADVVSGVQRLTNSLC